MFEINGCEGERARSGFKGTLAHLCVISERRPRTIVGKSLFYECPSAQNPELSLR